MTEEEHWQSKGDASTHAVHNRHVDTDKLPLPSPLQVSIKPGSHSSGLPEEDNGSPETNPTQSSSFTIMEVEEPETGVNVSKRQTIAIITSITGITSISSLLTGILTVDIPVISRELDISPDIQLWPMAAYAMACGCALMPCGVVADVLGCRRACLLGGLLQTAATIGSGLSATSTQLIALRVLAGVSSSICLPGGVGVAANSFPSNVHPRRRSAAFASMGGGQAAAFGIGLAIGGVFADTIGWRWGFYVVAILNGITLLLAAWTLPSAIDGTLGRETMQRLANEVDWIGAGVISTALALVSYVLAVTTGSDARTELSKPINIVLLVVGALLFPVFVYWMHRQEKHSRPALIPNSLWRSNLPFTAICITVFLVWGTLNSSEQLATLYFQDVRHESAMTSSLYFLPAAICGLLMNFIVAAFLPYLRPSLGVPFACLLSAIGPLLLATLARINGPGYWNGIFQAMVLNPVGPDIIYTIANLITTAAFPTKTQALAGGVFNMLAEIGKSVGLATSSVIARQISAQSVSTNQRESLISGYKAGWWYNSALAFFSVMVSYWGLRKVHKLGVKTD